MEFHADQEAVRILGNSINFSRLGQAAPGRPGAGRAAGRGSCLGATAQEGGRRHGLSYSTDVSVCIGARIRDPGKTRRWSGILRWECYRFWYSFSGQNRAFRGREAGTDAR
jgi:hypothetical protein